MAARRSVIFVFALDNAHTFSGGKKISWNVDIFVSLKVVQNAHGMFTMFTEQFSPLMFFQMLNDIFDFELLRSLYHWSRVWGANLSRCALLTVSTKQYAIMRLKIVANAFCRHSVSLCLLASVNQRLGTARHWSSFWCNDTAGFLCVSIIKWDDVNQFEIVRLRASL